MTDTDPRELTALDEQDLDDVHGIIHGAEVAARWILRVIIFALGVGVGIVINSIDH